MRFLFYIIIACCLFASCRPQRAVYNYLEDVNDTAFKKNVYIAESVIQKNDLLSIQVYSAATDPLVDQLYNLPVLQSGGMQQQTGGGQLGGYLVDVNGNIEMPRIGVMKAEGLKKSELEAIIKGKLEGQLTRPTIIVRFLNFRISVLGK